MLKNLVHELPWLCHLIYCNCGMRCWSFKVLNKNQVIEHTSVVPEWEDKKKYTNNQEANADIWRLNRSVTQHKNNVISLMIKKQYERTNLTVSKLGNQFLSSFLMFYLVTVRNYSIKLKLMSLLCLNTAQTLKLLIFQPVTKSDELKVSKMSPIQTWDY